MSETEQDKSVEEESSQTEETEAQEDEAQETEAKSNAADVNVEINVKSNLESGPVTWSSPGDVTLSNSAIADLPSIEAKTIQKEDASGPVEGKDDAWLHQAYFASVDSTSPASSASKSKSKSKQSAKSKRLNSKTRSKVEGKSSASGSSQESSRSKVDGMSSGSSQARSRSKVDDISGAKIGFLGAGRMTESIVKGLLKADKVKAKQLYVAAKTSKNLDTFKVQGVVTTTRSYDLFGKSDCDIIFLNVHGFVVRNCFKLGGTRPCPITTNYIPTRKRPIFILSLIGGVPLADVKTVLLNPETANKYKVEMHRVVLNTSVAYGLGLGLLDVELDSKKCNSLVRDTLQALGKIEFMEPDQMDSACSLIGNGMAFVYYFISALADGGFKMGLAKAKATKLATKAVECAAKCLLETNKNPGELRDSVISPSGGAIYGIHVLEQQDCASGIHAAVEASYRRIKELVEVEK